MPADPAEDLLADPSRFVPAAAAEPVLDATEAHDAFDRLTRLACRVFSADWAMLVLLVDGREIVESIAGNVTPERIARGTAPSDSFCRLVAQAGEPVALEDVEQIAALRDHPAVQRLGVRAYLGVPVTGDGAPVGGVLCVAQQSPYAWRSEDVRTLEDIAALASAEIERQRSRASARQGEETLVAAAAMMHALVEQSLAGIYVARDDRLTYVNPGLAEIFGAPREALTGRRVLELIAPEDRPAAAELLRGGPEEPITFRHTFRGRHANGGLLHLEVHGTRTDVDDGVAAIGVVLDITERVHAEAEREVARRERDRFFAMASHELRTPLSAIILFNELLLTGVYGPTNPQQTDALERLKRSAGHLLELINDILDLSKLQAGRLETAEERVDLAEITRAAVQELGPLARQYGSELHLELPPHPVPLTADPRRVRQIVLNLLSNAAKYGNAQPITVHCGCTRHEASVAVADRGPGIAPEDQVRIWEEFVQLGGVVAEGTGLGLTIARNLAELLGGRIELESRAGYGSTFRLVLPR